MTSLPADAPEIETEHDRLERNWSELLQELRVIQTGTQILTGFLLTVAFAQRFVDLDEYQVTAYLTLVIVAGLTTALGLAPVSLHRTLFRRRAKETIVRITNRILQVTLFRVALTLSGDYQASTAQVIWQPLRASAPAGRLQMAALQGGALVLYGLINAWAIAGGAWFGRVGWPRSMSGLLRRVAQA